jgi:predicted nuclease with TOPRIM domain
MSIATRTDSDTMHSLIGHMKNMNMTDSMARDRQARRENERLEEITGDQEDANRRLRKKNKELEAKLEDAEDLILYWANSSETFRRTILHLQDCWTPAPEEAHLKENINTLVNAKGAELAADPNWKSEREVKNERRRERRKATSPTR